MPPVLGSILSDASRFVVSFVASIHGCPYDPASHKPCPPPRGRFKRFPDKQPGPYENWLASRRSGKGGPDLPPGALRPFTLDHILLAYDLTKYCAPDILSRLWALHPYRISLMITLDILRGVFPAFRGYSQALMLDELQRMVISGNFMIMHILRQAGLEIIRMIVEAAADHIATSNESIVHGSARFLVEHRQMEHRLQLDIPTLADPTVRDLLQESDMFVRSFNGFSAFGLFSPFDFLRVLTLISELTTHLWVLFALTFGGRTPLSVILLSLALSALPSALAWAGGERRYWDRCSAGQQLEARLAAKQDAMRRLAHSDAYRPEVMLFNLGPWILKAWSRARKALINLEQRERGHDGDFTSRLMSRVYLSGLSSTFQNVPLLLVLHSTSTSVGSLTLYRTTLQTVFVTAEALVHTLRMAFQGIFLMGAFCAATSLKPRLEPDANRLLPYRPSSRGMSIEVRNLCYTYPGSKQPALRNVSLTINPGETIAIVGYNGSGKTTLAHVLLRLFDHDGLGGALRLNGTDARRLAPRDVHARASAVLQGFARFGGASVRANVGVGFVPDMHAPGAVDAALALAGAETLVRGLPEGVRTRLSGGAGAGDGLDGSSEGTACAEAFCGDGLGAQPHGLSGGEWQRIAISRAFMRARRPEVELLVFDEPTSSLDAHAQKHVFDTIEDISRGPDGERIKTVLYITHRLATARRADRVAMMENGTIVEVGTHEELLAHNGRYAALYQASV